MKYAHQLTMNESSDWSRWRDYAFVQINDSICRVVGDVAQDQAYVLLRYYRESSESPWVKPSVYSMEVERPSLLGLYECPVITTGPTGWRLGILDLTRQNFDRFWDPVLNEHATDLRRFVDAAEALVGLSGSRLIGLESAMSDVDLVVYGEDCVTAGRRLLQRLATDVDRVIPPSVAFDGFLNACETRPDDIIERNAFTGLISWQGIKRKLDLNYSDCENWVSPAKVHSVDGTPDARREMQRLRVIDSSRRYFFRSSKMRLG